MTGFYAGRTMTPTLTVSEALVTDPPQAPPLTAVLAALRQMGDLFRHLGNHDTAAMCVHAADRLRRMDSLLLDIAGYLDGFHDPEAGRWRERAREEAK